MCTPVTSTLSQLFVHQQCVEAPNVSDASVVRLLCLDGLMSMSVNVCKVNSVLLDEAQTRLSFQNLFRPSSDTARHYVGQPIFLSL